MTVTVECFDGHDLVVEVAVAEPVLGPEVEVVVDGDRAGGALVLADREELGEGAGTSYGGLVVAGVGADLVGTSVRGDRAQALGLTAGVVGAVGLDNVVLGLGRVDPAVHSKVRARAGGVIGGRVGDGAVKGQHRGGNWGNKVKGGSPLTHLFEPVRHPRPTTKSLFTPLSQYMENWPAPWL